MEAPTSHPSSRLLLPRRVQKLQLAPGERLTVFSHGSVWIADVSCGTPPTRCASLVARHALRASPNAALLRDTRSICGGRAWHGLLAQGSTPRCNVGSAATAERTMDCLANMATKKKKGEAEFQMLRIGAGNPNGSCHVKGLNHGAPTAVTHAHVPDTARMDSSTFTVTGLSDNFTAVRSFLASSRHGRWAHRPGHCTHPQEIRLASKSRTMASSRKASTQRFLSIGSKTRKVSLNVNCAHRGTMAAETSSCNHCCIQITFDTPSPRDHESGKLCAC